MYVKYLYFKRRSPALLVPRRLDRLGTRQPYVYQGRIEPPKAAREHVTRIDSEVTHVTKTSEMHDIVGASLSE